MQGLRRMTDFVARIWLIDPTSIAKRALSYPFGG
jgi:hypothetical protein